ncbi:TIM barrel protein [Acidobacteria bacterium AB60]|nr:TIM barrel protein [Acidobacteria bacterium AB60]
MSVIASMQGRLVPPEGGRFQSFPRERWRDEFPLATTAGLNAIEWIFDAYGEDANPLATDAGVAEMRRLSERTGVSVRSVCADYFMDLPFLRTTRDERNDRIQKFHWLLSRCAFAGIGRVVVPFVDHSRIQNEAEKLELSSILREILSSANAHGVELHLETSLPPKEFAELLERNAHPMLRANYDSGNSASLGYSVLEEFAAYGHWIGSVHIKDRLRNGGTVPINAGNANFPALFDSLARLDYSGDFVLQVARQEAGKEGEWLAENRVWLANQIEKMKGVR